MDKKVIITVLVFSLMIIILGWILVGSLEKKREEREKDVKLPSKDSIVYYYGITCPHCKEVEEWLKKNKIEEKIKIEKKEVWNNQDNALELQKVVESCNLNPANVGVPFLYADGKCFMGTPDVIKVLETKSKIPLEGRAGKNQNAK